MRGPVSLGLALVFLYSAAFRLAVLDRPFDYDAEGTSAAQYGMLARSYLEFGWHQAHGMPVLTVGHFPTAPIVSYPDHPPFIPAVILPFYAAFGVGEWQTRLPISILTLAAIFVLYRLLAVTAGHRAGLAAAAVFAASPMILTFGGMPEVIGTPLILFVLLSVLTYLRFHTEPRVSTLAFFLAAFALAAQCDWPAFVMVPVFAAHFVMTKPRTEWRWIVTFGAGACALFVAVYAYVALATHSPWYWMLQLLGRHSSVAGGQGFTLTEWLAAAYGLNRMLHTLVLLVPSGLWLMLFGFRVRHSQPGAAVARLLLAWGALCILAANKTAYSHEFMWIVLTPGIAVSTALLVEWLFQASAQRGVFGPMATLAALGLTMFASWTAYATLRTLYPATPLAPFTPMEMGRAIRAAAPGPGDLALVVGSDGGPGAQMWFYGDRALRINAWTISEVQERVRADTADLLFDFRVQPWNAAASGIVFPRRWESQFGNIRTYLEGQYPTVRLPPDLSGKFEVFRVPALIPDP